MATKSRRPLRIDRYVQLVRQFPLVHITSEAELDRAIAVIDNLLEKDRRADARRVSYRPLWGLGYFAELIPGAYAAGLIHGAPSGRAKNSIADGIGRITLTR